MRVIVGVDGSAGSFGATEFVGRLLSPERDSILLYYAPPELSVRSGSVQDPHIFVRAREALAQAVFDEAKTRLPKGLAHQAETVAGEQAPAHGLLVAADESRADLIVVGARGVGRFEQLVLGSVSRSIVHAATVPVLVVRPQTNGRPGKGLRVLLACDGSEQSKHAGEILQGFSWPEESVGRVMTALETLLAGHVPQWLEEQARKTDTEAMAKAWVEEHEDEKRKAQEEMLRYCGELPSIFQGQPPIVAEGHPAEQILKAIKAESIDLAVLGARGLGPISRLFLGSTSDYVLAHAPCSVLVARQHEKP